MNLAETYAAAAAAVAASAHQLAGSGGANPDASAHALRSIHNTLEQLIAAESSPSTIAGLQQLVASLHTAGTITSDRAFQIAETLNRIATNYGDLAAGLNGLW
jgi:hypothetical protein